MKHTILDVDHWDACEDATEFAEQFNTLEQAWQACQRGDWMLFSAKKE